MNEPHDGSGIQATSSISSSSSRMPGSTKGSPQIAWLHISGSVTSTSVASGATSVVAPAGTVSGPTGTVTVGAKLSLSSLKYTNSVSLPSVLTAVIDRFGSAPSTASFSSYGISLLMS